MPAPNTHLGYTPVGVAMIKRKVIYQKFICA